jgi:hypothetical protein
MICTMITWEKVPNQGDWLSLLCIETSLLPLIKCGTGTAHPLLTMIDR